MDNYKSIETQRPHAKILLENKERNKTFGRQNLSFDNKSLKIKTKFVYSGKCEQLWNAFDRPTQVTLKKVILRSGRVDRRAERDKSQFIKSKVGSLPPIKSIFKKFRETGERFEVDSDDEYGVISKNIYKFY